MHEFLEDALYDNLKYRPDAATLLQHPVRSLFFRNNMKTSTIYSLHSRSFYPQFITSYKKEKAFLKHYTPPALKASSSRNVRGSTKGSSQKGPRESRRSLLGHTRRQLIESSRVYCDDSVIGGSD